MILPRVTWTLDGKQIRAGSDWSATGGPGGHDQARATIPETDFRAAAGATQGSTVAADTEDGERIWEGRLSAFPQIKNGEASLAMQGHQFKARKKQDRLLIQSRDMSQWSPVDADPLTGGDNLRRMQVQMDGGRLLYKVLGGQALVAGANNRNGFAFWAEGCDLTKISFDMDYEAADDDTNLEFQTARVDGPSISGATVIDTFTTNAANENATKTSTPGTPQDTLILYLRVNTNETPANAQRYVVKNVIVWGAPDGTTTTTATTYNASDVLGYIATQLGWDDNGIAGSTFNVLPFDRTDDWGANADAVCEMEDRWWRVVDDKGSGPYVESDTWANSNNWRVQVAFGADPDLTPLELFDKVVVHFDTPAGVQKQRSATSTTVSVDNTFHFQMGDRQGANTLADAVASVLLFKYSTQRYRGNIEVVRAMDDNGRTNPYLIRHGDTITIEDWTIGEGITLRVEDVEYTPTRVRVSVGDVTDASIVRAIARSVRKKGR